MEAHDSIYMRSTCFRNTLSVRALRAYFATQQFDSPTGLGSKKPFT